MNKQKKIITAIAGGITGVLLLSACASDADTAAYNLSIAAEQFEIERRIVFFNGITDKYLLEIQGLCSVETGDSALSGSLEVTCKVGPTAFKKHFLGLSDNVSYLVEQTKGSKVSVYRYRVIFRPDVIIPDVDLKTNWGK
jgi:kynureninase